MEGIIKVSTEQLRNTAGEFGTQGNQINTLTAEMMNIVTGLAANWEGAASQAYIQKFRGLEDDIARLNRMVQEHVTDLNDMAQAYETAENEATNLTSALASDVLM